MYRKFLKTTKSLTVSLEKGLNALTTQEHNPLYFHGALPLYIFWFLIFSGIMLWMYYIPTLERAWSSVNYITSLPVLSQVDGKWVTDATNASTGIPYGAVVRGVHRWGAAGMMIATVLHMLRVYFTDRHRSWRWLPWISGVGLLAVLLFVGVTGYLLVWDNRAYTMVVQTSELLSALPLVGHAMADFFVAGGQITDYTITRFFFFHIAGATLIFVLVWVHFIRLKYPAVTPSRATNFLTFGFILAAAGSFPAVNITKELLVKYGADSRITQYKGFIISDAPAHIGLTISQIDPTAGMRYDAWYMFPYYLIEKVGPYWTWAVLGIAVALLLVAPFYPKDIRDNIAVVTEAKCTGCTFCSLDCPFEAIDMVERAPGSKFKLLAVVNEARCSECGVCVGACPFLAIELPNTHSKTIEADVMALLNQGA